MRVFPSFAYFRLPFCISVNVRASRLSTVASGSQARNAPDEIKQAFSSAIYCFLLSCLFEMAVKLAIIHKIYVYMQ